MGAAWNSRGALPALLGLSLALVAACNGTLRIGVPGGDGGAGGAGGVCSRSSECGADRLCTDGHCVVTSEVCSFQEPQGACPSGRLCVGGVCRLDTGDSGGCSPACAVTAVCVADTCVDIATNPCDVGNPTGLCRQGEVCVGGNCVPLYDTFYCSADHPNCLCPPGSGCDGNFCRPLDELPCNAQNPLAGLCAAGQTCINGVCSPALCSFSQPCGTCAELDQVCLDSVCTDENVLTTCEALDCAALHRQGCDTSAAVPECLDCISGYVETSPGGPCAPAGCVELACEAAGRVCDVVGGSASCGGCLGGHHLEGSDCVPDTCADIGCDGQHRECDPGAPPACGACLAGFHEVAGSCAADDCVSLGCAAANRVCDSGSVPAACAGCLPTYSENFAGACVHCQATAECLIGEHCNLQVGECEQDCPPACAAGMECDPYGRCIAETPVLTEGVCAAGISEGELVEPIVMILVDQSGSMWGAAAARYGCDANSCGACTQCSACCSESADNALCCERWGEARHVLMASTVGGDGSDGVITQLEDVVKFGVVFYTYDDTPGGGGVITPNEAECPFLTDIQRVDGRCGNGTECGLDDDCNPGGCTPIRSPYEITGAGAATTPALFNATPVRTLFDALRPVEDTPTGDSIDIVVDYLLTLADPAPKYILLVTDGEPDSCETPDPSGGAQATAAQNEAIAAAARAYANGIPLYNVSVGADVSNQHMQDVANAGSGTGLAPGTPSTTPGSAPFFVATDPVQLKAALTQVIGRTLSCVIELNTTGDLPSDGEVYIDGETTVRGIDWELSAPDTVTILGDACDAVTDGQAHFIAAQFTVCGGG